MGVSMAIVDTILSVSDSAWFIPSAVVGIAAVAFAMSIRRARQRRQLQRAADIESRLRD